jgi:hypothetical protein
MDKPGNQKGIVEAGGEVETHDNKCSLCQKLGNLETCPVGAGTEQEPEKWDIETMYCSEYVEDETKESPELEAEERAAGGLE